MLLSIIIPVYNAQKYLEKCLESVAAAKSDDIEVILVDDGSKDNSPVICDEWEKKDSRFHAHHIVNGGVSNARNYGIENSSGQYIMFLDADDYIAIDKWDVIYDTMLNNHSDFVAFSYYTLFDDGKITDEPFEIDGRICEDEKVARQIMFASSRLNACWARIFRSDLIKNNKIRFESGVAIGEDARFVTEYFCLCKTFKFINDGILYYRQHSQSAMRKYDITDRLNYTYPLYEYSYDRLHAFKDAELEREVSVYYFRVLTNLFREYSSLKDTKIILKNDWTKRILSEVDKSKLGGLKKVEYLLIKLKINIFIVCYFRLKGYIS